MPEQEREKMSITYTPETDVKVRVTIPAAIEVTCVVYEGERGRTTTRWRAGTRMLGVYTPSEGRSFNSRRAAVADAKRRLREWAKSLNA